MAVTCVDDNPVAVNDSATKAEDSGATAIDVLANDTDTDGGPKTIQSTSDPANGTVVITGGGTGLTYGPMPTTATDGGPGHLHLHAGNGGSTATVSVTVTCVDDDPVAVNDSATVAEDSGATPIDVLANDTDVDGGPIDRRLGDPPRQRHGRDHRRRRRPHLPARRELLQRRRRRPPTPSPTR